ncbi:MAG: Nif11-like leader peptide family natural product precursor [Cyanobacteria bacterium P01_A01_bin.83]
MSIKNAKALYTKLLADEEFRRKLEGASSYLQRVQILQSAGFSCTPTELNIAKNEMLQFDQGNRDLSDVEQKYIVGGSSLKSLLDRFDRYLFKEK